jgi:hypothetical protein
VKLIPTRSLRLRGAHVALLGCLAFSAQVACSDAPVSPSPYVPPQGTSGTATGTAGTPATTGGTAPTGTAGTTTTTGGTFSSGGTFGTAGTDTGGTFTTAGTATGGAAAGTDAGGTTAGTGGTPEPPKPYCDGKTLSPLPYIVNTGFQLSGWSPSTAGQLTANGDVTTPPTNACLTRVANAVGDCSMWRYTKNANPSPFWVQWITQWSPTFKHDNVCLAAGAKAVTFSAKGVAGGEVIQFSAGQGMQKKSVTLTKEWALYFVPIDTTDYNGFAAGVYEGFAWEMSPVADTATTEFFLDNIQWVATVPVEAK